MELDKLQVAILFFTLIGSSVIFVLTGLEPLFEWVGEKLCRVLPDSVKVLITFWFIMLFIYMAISLSSLMQGIQDVCH